MVIRHGEPPSDGVAIYVFLPRELLQSYWGSEDFFWMATLPLVDQDDEEKLCATLKIYLYSNTLKNIPPF